jgi:hypothetical protein
MDAYAIYLLGAFVVLSLGMVWVVDGRVKKVREDIGSVKEEMRVELAGLREMLKKLTNG